MEKRYQVFVSSTFRDLEKERSQVIQALLELDCIPSGMEIFPAADEEQWEFIKGVIDDCDYYVLILAGRYGSIHPETKKSYTQMEYEYAVEKGKPCIAFAHDDIESLSVANSEPDREGRKKLSAFRKSLERLYKPWNNAEQLGGLVSRSMVKLMKSRPAVGWVRADLVPDESAAQEIARLRRQIEDLKGELAKDKVIPYIDSASLAQGNQSFEVTFVYEEWGYDPDGDHTLIDKKGSCQITWNGLFSFISPHMLMDIQDKELRQVTNDFVGEIFANSKRKSGKVEGLYVKDSDFQTIKIQLMCLQLIMEFNEKWRLSGIGKQKMMELKTVQQTDKS